MSKITFCPKAKLCLYLFWAENQHYPLTFVAINAAGGQMDTGNDLIDVEFRKNGQMLWAILTPGKDLRGDNDDCMGLSFLAKTLTWHGRSNFNMLVDGSTMEVHTNYKGEHYLIHFQKPWYRLLNRPICSRSFVLLHVLESLSYLPQNQCDSLRMHIIKNFFFNR